MEIVVLYKQCLMETESTIDTQSEAAGAPEALPSGDVAKRRSDAFRNALRCQAMLQMLQGNDEDDSDLARHYRISFSAALFAATEGLV